MGDRRDRYYKHSFTVTSFLREANETERSYQIPLLYLPTQMRFSIGGEREVK